MSKPNYNFDSTSWPSHRHAKEILHEFYASNTPNESLMCHRDFLIHLLKAYSDLIELPKCRRDFVVSTMRELAAAEQEGWSDDG